MLHASTLGGLLLRQGGHARIYAFHHWSGLLVPHPTRYIFDYRASYLDAIHSVQSVPETYPSKKGNPPISDFSSPGLADSIPKDFSSHTDLLIPGFAVLNDWWMPLFYLRNRFFLCTFSLSTPFFSASPPRKTYRRRKNSIRILQAP